MSRSMSFGGDARDVSAARRFVRGVLSDADRDRWSTVAEQAVSELVTNVVLHAHTEVFVLVQVDEDAVTVRVRDGSPSLPAPRSWGATATTGRGLSLVAALADEVGVAQAPDGKEVWFRVEDGGVDPDPVHGDPALGDWDLGDWDLEGSLDEPADPDPQLDPVAEPGVTTVSLTGVPMLLWTSAQEHYEAMLRELSLRAHAASGAVTPDLVAAGQALETLSAALAQATRDAQAVGAPLGALPQDHPTRLPRLPGAVDASFGVARVDAGRFLDLQDSLDVGTHLAVEGLMLTRPPLPEVIALRDWACEQVVAQVNGVRGSRWGGVHHSRFADPGSLDLPQPRWDETPLLTAEGAVVAVDDTNRVVGLSPAAETLLGWETEDLVGHRVVVIIPPTLREAHVAGFTRHLTTGEAHVLGVPVTLPVLRADGSEIDCRFLIERAPADAGRAVYLARLDPVPAAS